MIDFIVDFDDICWGEVEDTDRYHMTIKGTEWAPGIWAGTENQWIQIKDPKTGITKGIYLVIKVFLNERKIQINNVFGNIRSGDLIYPYVVKNGIQ